METPKQYIYDDGITFTFCLCCNARVYSQANVLCYDCLGRAADNNWSTDDSDIQVTISKLQDSRTHDKN